MHCCVPSGHCAIGVFQNLICAKYSADASAWYCLQEPGAVDSMTAHASLLTGVSPKDSACWACCCGALIHFSHMYAQFGCFALVASIHVSPHPVAPSCGMVSATCTLPSATS